MLELETEPLEKRELTLSPGRPPWPKDQWRRNQRRGMARLALRRRHWRRTSARFLTLGLWSI